MRSLGVNQTRLSEILSTDIHHIQRWLSGDSISNLPLEAGKAISAWYKLNKDDVSAKTSSSASCGIGDKLTAEGERKEKEIRKSIDSLDISSMDLLSATMDVHPTTSNVPPTTPEESRAIMNSCEANPNKLKSLLKGGDGTFDYLFDESGDDADEESKASGDAADFDEHDFENTTIFDEESKTIADAADIDEYDDENFLVEYDDKNVLVFLPPRPSVLPDWLLLPSRGDMPRFGTNALYIKCKLGADIQTLQIRGDTDLTTFGFGLQQLFPMHLSASAAVRLHYVGPGGHKIDIYDDKGWKLAKGELLATETSRLELSEIIPFEDRTADDMLSPYFCKKCKDFGHLDFDSHCMACMNYPEATTANDEPVSKRQKTRNVG